MFIPGPGFADQGEAVARIAEALLQELAGVAGDEVGGSGGIAVMQDAGDGQGRAALGAPQRGVEVVEGAVAVVEGIDFTTDLQVPVAESDVIFIAVGTPPLPTGEADLSYLGAAARGIGAALDGSRYRVVVNKSTVPVGCGNLVETLVREGIHEAKRAGHREIRFGVASNPEFLREGCAVADSLYPDRIVVGAADGRTLEL